MFGKDMMEKLQKMQAQAEVSKQKLDEILVTGEAGGNLVVVEMNGNRKLTNLSINTALDQMDKEDLEDLLTVALNRAMDAANEANEKEMANSAKGIIPGL
ncbi:nucleoid-associated protein, YbaB/EbfC family [Brumimicrobium salinarum]|uniref:Nucleoid-associated protein CW751_09450 n=1 Tax=Brumimicrobium salinarum TaxID=2058658 RepID=A0A2I0R1X4_9FLAO|nr:YbaB/EbfC family nucleoid-associated protein [Brumimicrobium salinarum]PKR80588.1 nucleoid-associated protein, YbaB/EbfC family [Brumimicrobium salinarum]